MGRRINRTSVKINVKLSYKSLVSGDSGNIPLDVSNHFNEK